MNLVLPTAAKKQITRNRARLAVSEQEYVQNALAHYAQLLTLDDQLREELASWDDASSKDFGAWSRKHRA